MSGDNPLVKCGACAGSGCRSCKNFGYVLTDQAAAEVEKFWRSVPVVAVDSVESMIEALRRMEA